MSITKGQAKAALGINTDSELARFLGVTKQAVSQIGDDDAELPDGRQWQLRALRPDIFGPAPDKSEASDVA